MPVCGSTEDQLSQWLRTPGDDGGAGGDQPRAVLARRQRFGHGQRGRAWSSPPGGIWLSASLPWRTDASTGASLSLAVAVGLALELESLGLTVRIKWPNDLLVQNRKIAGLLPRLRLRGDRVVGARVGLGLNGWNRVPAGAINLSEAMASGRGEAMVPGCRERLSSVPDLAARTLRALEWALRAASDGEAVRRAAEARLLPGAEPVIVDGEAWEPIGLDRDGALRVLRQGTERRLVRTF